MEIFSAPQTSGTHQIERGAIAYQGVHCLKFLMSQRREERARWLGAVIAEEVNQGNLHATLARHAT
jgi:hypothetical protein